MTIKSPGRVTSGDIYQNKEVTEQKETTIKNKELQVFTITGKQHEYNEGGFPILYDVDSGAAIDLAEDSNLAYAKKYTNGTKVECFVKSGDGGQLYNPIGMFEGAGKTTGGSRMGKKKYTWIKVNPKCFAFYIEFLKTKNGRHLINAQREII